MIPYWTKVAQLGVESAQVIWLRSLLLAAGGARAQKEVALMTSEKIAAAFEAYSGSMLGASPERVLLGYRKRVRANARRLKG